MAYDEELAARVRGILGGRTEAEKPMFGGLAMMVDGRMAVAISGQGGLMLRTDATEHAALVERPHVEAVTMGGRASKTWVHVASEAIATDAALEEWVARGLAG